MPRLISCGVIVRRALGELLLGHATGRNYWDIPKGLRDNDETSIAAALRELREEAGIELDELRLQDLGVHKYLPSKDLHLFLLNPPDPALNIELCHCSTHYMPRYGTREVPEIDAYRWTKRAEVPDLCGKNMTRVLMALEW
jgi:putative (di)nucleoside polyphosphate hydrolase